MRIGISFAPRVHDSLWNDSIAQQALFLALALRALPMVEDVILLSAGAHLTLPSQALTAGLSFRLVPAREATDLIDVAIEMETPLDLEWLDRIRAMGKKVVHFCCRQPYTDLIEPTIFHRPKAFARPERCDEVWVFSKDRVFAPMLRSLHRCAVFEMPYLWDAVLMTARAKELSKLGYTFGYQPANARANAHARPNPNPATGFSETSPRPWRAAIFAANDSVTSVCSVPMLICDAAARTSPGSIAAMHIVNAGDMALHQTFKFMRQASAVADKNTVLSKAGTDFPDYMARHADVVVAHQWQDAQSSLYLDALYGGYPLIHNAPWLNGQGYFYPDFAIEEGARLLVSAVAQHDAHHADYLSRSQQFLATLSPQAPGNQRDYARRLLALTGRQIGVSVSR